MKAKTTKHTCNGPAFGKLTDGCPRCEELKAGAKPIKWNTHKADEQKRLIEAIRRHDCKASGCGPVCTAFDY
jgi:hypothetical protein